MDVNISPITFDLTSSDTGQAVWCTSAVWNVKGIVLLRLLMSCLCCVKHVLANVFFTPFGYPFGGGGFGAQPAQNLKFPQKSKFPKFF